MLNVELLKREKLVVYPPPTRDMGTPPLHYTYTPLEIDIATFSLVLVSIYIIDLMSERTN